MVVEVGPRMQFTTAWSSNAVAICHACGLNCVTRIELSRRYLVGGDKAAIGSFTELVHDRMTEMLVHHSL